MGVGCRYKKRSQHFKHGQRQTCSQFEHAQANYTPRALLINVKTIRRIFLFATFFID